MFPHWKGTFLVPVPRRMNSCFFVFFKYDFYEEIAHSNTTSRSLNALLCNGKKWNQAVGPIRATSGDCRAEMKKIPYLLFPFLKSHWPFSITLVTARGDVILHCLHPMLVLREDALPLGIQISFRSCQIPRTKPHNFLFLSLLSLEEEKIWMPSIFKDAFPCSLPKLL